MPYSDLCKHYMTEVTYSVELHLEHSLLAFRFELYMCPGETSQKTYQSPIYQSCSDAGISPAGTFYCCEYFTLFSVVIYLAFRDLGGSNKIDASPELPNSSPKSHQLKMHNFALRWLVLPVHLPSSAYI